MLFEKKKPRILTVNDFEIDSDFSKIPIAYDDSNNVVYWDTNKNRHILLMGGTGSGKTWMGRNIVDGLTRFNSNNILYAVDFTRVEWNIYRTAFVRVLCFPVEIPDFVEDIKRRAKPLIDTYTKQNLTPNIFIVIEDVGEFLFDDYHKAFWTDILNLCREFPNIHLVLLGQGFWGNTITDEILQDSLPVMLGNIREEDQIKLFSQKYDITINPTNKGEGCIKQGEILKKIHSFGNTDTFENWFFRGMKKK